MARPQDARTFKSTPRRRTAYDAPMRGENGVATLSPNSELSSPRNPAVKNSASM